MSPGVPQVSGLSKWVSGHLAALATLDPWVIGMLLTLFIAVTTEVTSNAATTTLFVPIVGDLVSTQQNVYESSNYSEDTKDVKFPAVCLSDLTG